MTSRRRAVALTVSLVGFLSMAVGMAEGANSAGAAETETIVGTASITHAPPGWQPSNFYLVLCPATVHFSLFCEGQQSGSPNQVTGRFTVKIPATPWNLGMYYYTINGQMIPSKPVSVPSQPGKVISQSVSMRYVIPAVHGKVFLTGAPKDFNDLAYMGVQACPGKAVFRVGCRGGAEAYEDVGPGSSYLIDLGAGSWKVADYYWNDANTKVFSGTPMSVTAVAEVTKTVNVTIAYQGI